MAAGTRICKVCGKEYEYCRTLKQVSGVFRWQDVACSPEHGSIYLARILASRSASVSAETQESEQVGEADADEETFLDIDEEEDTDDWDADSDEEDEEEEEI